MLDLKNVSPRLGRSTVVIPNGAMVHVIYMNTGGLPKSFAYCVPNFGGQLKQMPRDLFYGYMLFAPFTKCKILALLLLIKLKCFDETMDVNPMA
eukprot:8431796-Ditylum_brightwellii.AAC.1